MVAQQDHGAGFEGCRGLRVEGNWLLESLVGLRITHLFKDSYKEIIIRNPKRVGYSGLR